MDLRADDRGVSEVVGSILVFGMLVIAFTVYQGIIVPDQNRQVEFQHNQEVQGELQDLRNAIVTTAVTGSGQAVSVTLGASYPRRAIASNLGVSGGSLQTVDPGSGPIRVDNARAIDAETADYFDGSLHAFETKAVRYTPVYSFYSSAPTTVYENSLVYNQFGGANVTVTDQVIVEGRRITLIAVNGSLTRTERDTVSIGTEAISASANRVAVRNTTGERVNVTIPSRLSAAKWREVLAGEMGAAGYVDGVYDVPGAEAVNISMEPGVTYELRMAKVGVGGATAEESPTYVTAIEGDDVSVPEGGTQRLVVEVRDRYNNPVSNATVEATIALSAGTGDVVTPSSETTDTAGRASFTYEAPDDVNGAQEADVEVTFGGGGDPKRTVTYDLQVLDSDGSGGSGGAGGGGGGGTGSINPNDDDAVVLVDEVYDDGGADCGNNNDCRVAVTLDNTGSTTRTIQSIRYNFYSVDAQGGGGGGSTVPEYVQINGSTLELRGQFTSVGSPELPPGETTVAMCFFMGSTPSPGNAYSVEFGDFYILSVEFGDNSQATYFIPPVSGTPGSVDYDCAGP